MSIELKRKAHRERVNRRKLKAAEIKTLDEYADALIKLIQYGLVTINSQSGYSFTERGLALLDTEAMIGQKDKAFAMLETLNAGWQAR